MDKKFVIAILLPVGSVLMMFIFPIPTLVLDILIAVNLFFAFALLIAVLLTRETSDFSLLPTLFFISTVYSTAGYTATAISIFTKGTDFDGRLIRFVSTLFFRSGESGNMIIGSVIFIVMIAIVAVITKKVTRDAEIEARITLDFSLIQAKLIKADYDSGEINEGEATSQRVANQKKPDFFGSLDGVCQYIFRNVKVNVFIIGIIAISGGLLVDILQNGKSFNEAAVPYIPLAVGSGILFMFPPLLLSIAISKIINNEADEDFKPFYQGKTALSDSDMDNIKKLAIEIAIALKSSELSDSDIDKIKRLARQGWQADEIACVYKISENDVNTIIKEK